MTRLQPRQNAFRRCLTALAVAACATWSLGVGASAAQPAPTTAGAGIAGPDGARASWTVALWSLDEPSGSRVLVDASGSGHHGRIGADVATGITAGDALVHRFPAVAAGQGRPVRGHVNRVPESDALDPGAGNFTVTVRLRTTAPLGNIVQKGQASDLGGYWKFQGTDGIPTCVFRGADHSSRTGWSTRRIDDGRWHTLRCVRTAKFVEMWVDGVRTSRTQGRSGIINNSQEVTIGGKTRCDDVVVTCDYFMGDIDVIRVERGSKGTPNIAALAAAETSVTARMPPAGRAP